MKLTDLINSNILTPNIVRDLSRFNYIPDPPKQEGVQHYVIAGGFADAKRYISENGIWKATYDLDSVWDIECEFPDAPRAPLCFLHFTKFSTRNPLLSALISGPLLLEEFSAKLMINHLNHGCTLRVDGYPAVIFEEKVERREYEPLPPEEWLLYRRLMSDGDSGTDTFRFLDKLQVQRYAPPLFDLLDRRLDF